MSERTPIRRPDYFPLAAGRYEVKPGLFRFGKSLGGGDADGHVFQIDDTFPRYRAVKLANRAERLGKYFCTNRLAEPVAERVSRFIIDRLASEHPDLFERDHSTLTCRTTKERLVFNNRYELAGVHSPESIKPPYISALDALAMQVQEDLAIVSVVDGRDWLSAIHLSFSNFWAAEDKIGKPFPMVHQPVAGMEQMNRQSARLVDAMLGSTDGRVRFAWGITWDDVLNHHPDPPADGRKRAETFTPGQPRAFLRVERQTMWGFPEVQSALFTIRTYLYDVADVRQDPDRRRLLRSAIESMSEASLAYKRLGDARAALLEWLASEA